MRKSTLGVPHATTAVVLALMLSINCSAFAARKDRQADEDSRPTAVQLQSMVMSYADRYSTGIDGAMTDMRVEGVDSKLDITDRLALANSLVFSRVAAYTIASSPNPDVALLDLTVLTSLNRM